MTATLVTCSFRGDLDLCRLLCRSVDLYASSDFTHRLYVPRRDLALFEEFASPHRRIEAQESLIPPWLRKAPLPPSQWRRRLGLPRRNVYVSWRHGFVRGWIAQQIMKIAATLAAPDDLVAHLDSDAALIRPLTLNDLAPSGCARLYAGPVLSRGAGHALWYEAAGRLLGLPAVDYYRSEYISPLTVWRRGVVVAMVGRIAAVTDRDWASALAATPHFSEYVLYGVFAEHGLGLEAARLTREPNSPCLTRWVGDFADEADVAAFVAEATPEHLVCCLQSTLALPPAARERILGAAAGRVAAEEARRAA